MGCFLHYEALHIIASGRGTLNPMSKLNFAVLLYFFNDSNCDQNSEFYAILQSVYGMHLRAAPDEYKTVNQNKRRRQGNTAKSKMDLSNSGRKTCDNPVKKVGSFIQNKQVQLDEEHSERQLTALCQRMLL